MDNGEEANALKIPATPPVFVLYVFGVCLVAGIVRALSRWTVVHHTVIMFGIGAVCGYLSRQYESFRFYVNVEFLTSAKLLQLHTLLLPVVIMEYLFSMDPRVFLSCSPLAVMTVVLDYVLTLCLQGLFVFFLFDFYDVPSWTSIKTGLIYMLFGSLTSVTDTSYVVNTFYKMGSYWILVKLMETKRVISLMGICVVYIFIVYLHELNYMFEWYHIVIFTALQFVACPLIGWLAAQIMIFWLGRLYNDVNVEITISIATAYLLYYFGTVNITYKPMVSAITVVFYSLLLNNRRMCFSLGLDSFMHRLIRIMAYVVKTVIFTIAGFLITSEDFTQYGHTAFVFVPHLLIAGTLYSWCMLVRGTVAILLAPILRRCGYRLSWQELSTLVFCNVTGTVCLITAVASCNIALVDLFFDNRHIQIMLMFHMGMLAIVRSLVAGTMFRHVLMVLGMRKVSLGRYQAMSNALQKIQDQIKTSSRAYKFDRFLADADWDTVYQFTNFENPYKDISRYSVIDRCMELDAALLGDLRMNMLHAKRISFWRQYEQGLLSLRALRILLEECYLAEWKVTTTGYDIHDQIRKYYIMVKKFSMLKVLKQKFEFNQSVRRAIIADISQAVRGKVKAIVFKVGLHMALEVILIIAVVISCAASIAILVYESSCSTGWPHALTHMMFYEVNTVFMLFFSVYIALKLYIFKWRYMVLFGSVFNIFLLIFGWIDIALNGVVLRRPNEICAELIRTQWAITYIVVVNKIFVACRCLRLVLVLEDKTYFFVHTMKRRMLLQLQLGYDVGKAYVYCKEDVYHTAGEFVRQSTTLENVRRELQSTRVQLMRELATVQKQHPGIVVSVKSQEACRRILHVAKETVDQLQRNGRVDAYEADMLDEMIKLRLKRLNKIPAQIEMPSVDVLVSKLGWVHGNETIMSFLMFQSKQFNMAEGESVDFDSDPKAGLYIIVSGLIRVNWSIGDPYGKLLQSSHTSSHESLHSYGKMQLHDFTTTGSTFGELALLTETPVSISAVCETSVLMFHIQYESIRTALDWVKEPPLEERLWELAAVRLSLPLLKALPTYYHSSLEDLKLLIDNGQLIMKRLESQTEDGIVEEKFSLARNLSSHVLLIHGVANKSGEIIVGPRIVPPDNDDLVFSSVICDLFVLYTIPHKTAGTSVGFTVASVSASDLSTGVDTSKELQSQRAPKKRGRRMSVATGAAAPRHLDHAVLASPIRTIAESEIESVALQLGEDIDEEFEGTPEGSIKTSHVLFSPQVMKQLEESDLTEEMSSEMSVSPAKAMTVSPEEQEETVDVEEVSTAIQQNKSTQVDMVPRKSSSDVALRTPWTEAWKQIKPVVTLKIGKSSPAPAAAGAKVREKTAGIVRRNVADTSKSKPAADNERNANASNRSTNDSNNVSSNNIGLRQRYLSRAETQMWKNDGAAVISVLHENSYPADRVIRPAIFRPLEQYEDRTTAVDTDASTLVLDAVSSRSSERSVTLNGLDDDTTKQSHEAALRWPVDAKSSNSPFVTFLDDRDPGNVENSPAGSGSQASSPLTLPTIGFSGGCSLSTALKGPPPAVVSAAESDDLAREEDISFESDLPLTACYSDRRASKSPAATEPKRADVTLMEEEVAIRRDVEKDRLMSGVRTTHLKPVLSKKPGIGASFRSTARAVATRGRGTKLTQRIKNLARSTRIAGSSHSSFPKSAHEVKFISAAGTSSKASSQVKKPGQTEQLRSPPNSNFVESDADEDKNLPRGTGSCCKPTTESEKCPFTTSGIAFGPVAHPPLDSHADDIPLNNEDEGTCGGLTDSA